MSKVDLSTDIKSTLHKIVTDMVNQALIELKLLEDIISDQAEFITLFEGADKEAEKLTPMQRFILSKAITEAVDALQEAMLDELKNDTLEPETSSSD